jgi:hypothetical protein
VTASGCLVVLDAPTFMSWDARPADTLDTGAERVEDAVDLVLASDHAPTDAITSLDATSGDARTGFIGPAASGCDAAGLSPPIATYVGTTCDGLDQLSLSCNPGAHREIVIRIDGLPGQIWDVVPSPGLADALFLGTTCSAPPLVCGSGSLDGGGMISDGPFPVARTDYFVFETMSPTPCGPYSITVTLR